MSNIDNLIKTIKKLRDKKTGCEWDIKQTHESLLQYVIEEAYEVVDAIKNKTDEDIKEELGDLLLQIALHAIIAEENGKYNLNDVIKGLIEKIKRRHPHVFKYNKKLTEQELHTQWHKIKELENKAKINTKDPFSTISKSNTALLQTLEVSKIAKKFEFDWKNYEGPAKKIKEELSEVLREKENKIVSQKNIEEEIGDLLFSVVNLSRHLKVNPELALLFANQKFIKRFNLMLNEYESKKDFTQTTNKDKEKIWNKIKKLK